MGARLVADRRKAHRNVIRVPEIDGMRGVSIALVVLGHWMGGHIVPLFAPQATSGAGTWFEVYLFGYKEIGRAHV